jgi:hypothetical protein
MFSHNRAGNFDGYFLLGENNTRTQLQLIHGSFRIPLRLPDMLLAHVLCVFIRLENPSSGGGGTEVAAGGKIKAFFSRRYINRTWQEIEAGWNIDHTASATRESFQEFDTRRMQMSKKWTTRRRLIQLKNKTALEKRMDRSKSESYIPSWKPRM